jgi:hypothetical protein
MRRLHHPLPPLTTSALRILVEDGEDRGEVGRTGLGYITGYQDIRHNSNLLLFLYPTIYSI